MNTCPVGVATQDEQLRKHFSGKYEYLVNFFKFIAQDVREHLAEMGFHSLDEIIGRTELLERKELKGNPKIAKVKLSKIMFKPGEGTNNAIRHIKNQEHKIDKVLDKELIKKSLPALDLCMPVEIKHKIKNTDRTVGAMLSGEIAKRYGQAGLPNDTIKAYFTGSAGQSFGAFLSKGVYFQLEGEANDYLGKGLSGGKIVVVAPKESTFKPEENIIAGNTILYGATSGEVYINGVVGERFCVRNSGAVAVVEGAGDHCCEYMWQSSGKYVPRKDQLEQIAPVIIDMGCFARVETNGGASEQVNLLFGENPNKAVRAFTKPFNEAGIQTHMPHSPPLMPNRPC